MRRARLGTVSGYAVWLLAVLLIAELGVGCLAVDSGLRTGYLNSRCGYLISLASASSGFSLGIELKNRDDAQSESEESDGTGYPPLVRHLKWLIVGLCTVFGIASMSRGFWLFTEFKFWQGVPFVVAGCLFSVVGSLIECLVF